MTQEPIIGERMKLTIVSICLLLGLGLTIHYSINSSQEDIEAQESAEQNRPSPRHVFMRPAEDQVTTYKSKENAVTYSQDRDRSHGSHIVDTRGNFFDDRVDVAVVNPNGEVEFVQGSSIRGQEALSRQPADDFESQRISAGSQLLSSTIPSDNNAPSLVELPGGGSEE